MKYIPIVSIHSSQTIWWLMAKETEFNCAGGGIAISGIVPIFVFLSSSSQEQITTFYTSQSGFGFGILWNIKIIFLGLSFSIWLGLGNYWSFINQSIHFRYNQSNLDSENSVNIFC